MVQKYNIPFLDELTKGLAEGKTVMINENLSRGKSMMIPNMFEKWYSEGNRMPDNIGIRYYDFDGWIGEFIKLSDEMRIKQKNFIWFMMQYGGGFPNAELFEVKGENEN
jgi:hypothetical protein